MPRYYEPDLTVDPNSPFVRDAANKLVRRGYWMDMNDRTLVMVKSWLRLSEQNLRIDKWSVCQG